MIDPRGILMIHVGCTTSDEPVVDELTRKMAAALRAATRSSLSSRGVHVCACGVVSTNQVYYLGGRQINSLCVHYLAFHRDEVAQAELAKVAALTYESAEPTDQELQVPPCTVMPTNQGTMRGSTVAVSSWS